MSNWTKSDRLAATIVGEPTDRPPIAIWRHWPGDDQDAQALAEAHLKWQKDYDWDLIKVSPASSYCLVDWGVLAQWEGSFEGTRTYKERVVHAPEDWAKLAVLDPGSGMLATQIEALNLVNDGLASDFDDPPPFIATIFSPLAQAKNIAGEHRVLSHMRSDPDLLREGLEVIAESTIDYIQAARESGISGVFYAIQHARYAKMSVVEYQSFGRPYDEEILASASDLALNMVHVHGEEGIMFDLVADYPVQFVNWHDRDTGFGLSDGLKQVSGAVSGGVSRWSLYQDTPDAALAEAADALNQSGGRRLLLGVGCVAMTNTPLRNLKALRGFVDDVK
jgi:uroporphyrinogen decarboxylase